VNLRQPPLGLLLLLAAATLTAQTTDPAAGAAATDQPAKRVVPQGRLPEAKRSDKSAKYGKAVLPDPDLLDGSSYEKEKKPLHGMLSEIEIGENEGGRQDKISPNSGPGAAGAKPPEQDKPPAAGGAGAPPPPEQAQAAGAAEKVPEGQQAAAAGGAASAAAPAGGGPAAKAEGAQAANLKVPEGAANAAGAEANKPREQQIGDATLQIQTSSQKNADVVGTQASTSQQSDKKMPAGGSPNQSSGNVGVEKGRVVPKGL
jgi:hypothetical protein